MLPGSNCSVALITHQSARVATESSDVLLHPSERGDDVLQAEVSGVREHATVLGEREPTEGAEPVVQGHPNGAAGRGET